MVRARRTPDAGRIATALSRPGMDPRQWVELGIVTKIVIDPVHGPLADVLLLVSGEEVTARVGALYAGGGFGFYAPLKVDDEVLLGCPGGDPGNGWVVTTRMWCAADKPPTQCTEAAKIDDVLLVVESGHTLRIVTGGTGNIVLEVGAGGKLLLGSEQLSLPLDGLVHGSGIDTFTGQPYALLGNASDVVLGKK